MHVLVQPPPLARFPLLLLVCPLEADMPDPLGAPAAGLLVAREDPKATLADVDPTPAALVADAVEDTRWRKRRRARCWKVLLRTKAPTRWKVLLCWCQRRTWRCCLALRCLSRRRCLYRRCWWPRWRIHRAVLGGHVRAVGCGAVAGDAGGEEQVDNA